MGAFSSIRCEKLGVYPSSLASCPHRSPNSRRRQGKLIFYPLFPIVLLNELADCDMNWLAPRFLCSQDLSRCHLFILRSQVFQDCGGDCEWACGSILAFRHDPQCGHVVRQCRYVFSTSIVFILSTLSKILIFTFLFWNDQHSSRHRSPCTPPCSHLPTGSSRLPPLLRARLVPTAQHSSTRLVPLSGGHLALRSVSRLSLNSYSLALGRLCLLSSSIFGGPSDGIRCGRQWRWARLSFSLYTWSIHGCTAVRRSRR